MSYFTLRWLKNNNVAKTPCGIGNYLGPGQSVLSFIASRSSFLIGELLLGKLSETVVVVGNAPHDRPGFLVCHLIGTVRASSARKRQCSGSQKRTFCMASHHIN